MTDESISVLIYSSQNYLPIADLGTKEFNKFSKDLKIKKYLACNTFDIEYDFNYDEFELLDANVQIQNDSRQFAKVMINSLKKIQTKYVMFMLEDMFLTKNIKKENLISILNVMEDHDINHFSLMAYSHDWKKLEIDYQKYNLDENIFLEIPDSYIYMFSLQPSIWKRESLLEIFENNQNISIHEYDVSFIKNKRGEIRHGDNGHGYINTPENFWDYGFKHCCLNKKFETASYCFDDRPLDGDYFLYSYSGAMRFGKFDFNTHNNTREYITKFLNENNIDRSHKIYGKFFP